MAKSSTLNPDEQNDDGPPTRVSRDGAVLTITLNRPHRMNAMNLPAWEALGSALQSAGQDPDVRAVILTGAGGNFSTGADIEPRGSGHPTDRMRLVNSVAIALAELPKPTIAKVEGYAVGAGWNIALMCDFVVASSTAKFSQIFAKRGLSPDFGGSWLLPRLVGLQQAKRLVMLAETIGADEAAELGLVTWVKDFDEVDTFVQGIAAQLAAGAPIALAQSKALLEQGASNTIREALDGEARALAVNLATDAPEGFRALMEKRTPDFTGQWRVP